MAGENPESNRTMARLAAILDAVGRGSATASEIARSTDLSVSTTHRLALAMADYDFLLRQPDGSFRLGDRFTRTALQRAALPVMEELRDITGETVQLWVRRGDERLCLLSADSPQELRAILPEGSRLKLPAGSSGQLLSGAADAAQDVGNQGWTESVSRRTPGVCSVSAPVLDHGRLVAALCVAAPVARVNGSPGDRFGEQTVASAARITETLTSDSAR